jgi:alpha-mannosidase
VIVRVVNLSPASTTARLEFARPVSSAEAVTLLEESDTSEAVSVDGSAVLRSLRPWQIATVRASLAGEG